MLNDDKPWLSSDPAVREAWVRQSQSSHSIIERDTEGFAFRDLWSALDEARRERDAARAEVERLRIYAENDTHCPCCGTSVKCLEDCTFATDCGNRPEELTPDRMSRARAALAKLEAESEW